MGSFHTFVCDVCGAEGKSAGRYQEGIWRLPYGDWHRVRVGWGDQPAGDVQTGTAVVCSRSCGARLLRAHSLMEAQERNGEPLLVVVSAECQGKPRERAR